MKIYRKAGIAVDLREGYPVGTITAHLFPLTKNGKISKRDCGYWNNNLPGVEMIFSASQYRRSYEIRDKAYNVYCCFNLDKLTKLFPKAVFVITKEYLDFEDDQKQYDIYICGNKSGAPAVTYIHGINELIDNVIISKKRRLSGRREYIIRNILDIYDDRLEGESCCTNENNHEIILFKKGDRNFIVDTHRPDTMSYIDTRTFEIKRVRRFFEGIEL